MNTKGAQQEKGVLRLDVFGISGFSLLDSRKMCCVHGRRIQAIKGANVTMTNE